MKQLLGVLCLTAILLFSCQGGSENKANTTQEEAEQFINKYTEQYVKLYTAASEAQWNNNTVMKEGDSSLRLAAEKADQAMAEFTGSRENIETAKRLLVKD